MLSLCLLEYRVDDLERLKARARPVLRDGAAVPGGRSLARTAEFFAGRAALAAVLRRVGWDGFIDPDPTYGYLVTRPKAAGGSVPPHVNVTHTDGIAVAVAADCHVGVDVEAVARDARRAVSRVATEDELRGLDALTVSVGGRAVPGPVALWSAKEAVSKATGLGIKFGMSCFVVSLRGAAPYPVRIEREGPLHVDQPAVRFHCHDRYVISVCAERNRLENELDVASAAGRLG